MFADAGLAQGGGAGDEPELMKESLKGFLNSAAKINPFRWNSGTAQDIFSSMAAATGAESTRPVRLKELGQRMWVDQGAIDFDSMTDAAQWILTNYLDPALSSRRTLVEAGASLERVSTASIVAAGFGGEDAIRAAVGADNEGLVHKVRAILEGKSIPGSVENHGTISQLQFGGHRWEYQDSGGCWVPYEVDVCEKLNAADAGSTIPVGSCALIEADRGTANESIELFDSPQSHGMRESVRVEGDAAAKHRWIWYVPFPLSSHTVHITILGYQTEISRGVLLIMTLRSWAGDSGVGRNQDMWIPYEPHVCMRLEAARTRGEQHIELDPDNPGKRHIDLAQPANIKQW